MKLKNPIATLAKGELTIALRKKCKSKKKAGKKGPAKSNIKMTIVR